MEREPVRVARVSPGLGQASGSWPPPTRPPPTRANSVAGPAGIWPCLGSPDSESGLALPVSWAAAACRSGLVLQAGRRALAGAPVNRDITRFFPNPSSIALKLTRKNPVNSRGKSG